MREIRNVAVFGMGAVGSVLAWQMSRRKEIHIYGIVRDIGAYWGAPIIVDGRALQIDYRSIETMPGVPMDMILLCVRSYDFERTAELIRPLVGKDTLLLAFTSGIRRDEHLSRMYGRSGVVPCCLLGAQMNRNSRYVTVEREGVVWFGSNPATAEGTIDSLQMFWNRCGIRTRCSRRMDSVLWKAFLLESVREQTGFVFQQSYGEILENERARKVMREVQREIEGVAAACGTDPNEERLPSCEEYLSWLPSEGKSRMLQDSWQNRRMETDAFCDGFLRLAQEKEISVPACRWLREEILQMTERRNEAPICEGQFRNLSSRKGVTATPEIIAARLRSEIIQGKYTSGGRLAENELAARFYASRSSVRSALQILSGEGLIKTLPNGRREVCRFTNKELCDLFDMRWQLESMALDILLKNKDTVYPSLAEALGKIEKKYRTQSIVEEPEDLDVLFHRCLVQSADNLFLQNAWDSVARLWYAMMLSARQSQPRGRLLELFGKHRHLYELILARDAAVYPELKRHISEEKDNAAVMFGLL